MLLPAPSWFEGIDSGLSSCNQIIGSKICSYAPIYHQYESLQRQSKIPKLTFFPILAGAIIADEPKQVAFDVGPFLSLSPPSCSCTP